MGRFTLRIALAALSALSAQQEGRHGTAEQILVHGKGLGGKLEGDAADR
jgi:hypothetical protein